MAPFGQAHLDLSGTSSPVHAKRPEFDILAPPTGIVEKEGVSLFGESGVLSPGLSAIPTQPTDLSKVKPRSLGEQLAMVDRESPASPFHATSLPYDLPASPFGDGSINTPGLQGTPGANSKPKLTPLRPPSKRKGPGGRGVLGGGTAIGNQGGALPLPPPVPAVATSASVLTAPSQGELLELTKAQEGDGEFSAAF